MKKNDIIKVLIKDVIFPNKGIAYIESQKIILKGGIQGQKVKARITKKKKNKIEASILEVLEPSPIEISPKCEHFGQCGGCTFQNIPYNHQLNMKSQQVKRILEEANIKDYEFLGIEPSPLQYAYRSKMEFSFGDTIKDGPLTLGMHHKGKFYEIITTHNCQIVDQDFNKILKAVLEFFQEKKIPYFHKKTHQGSLRHLVIRKSYKTSQLLINLVTTSQQKLPLDLFREKLLSLSLSGKIMGILHTINDNLADIVQSDETKILYGQDFITEKILGLSFNISAFSFFQTNSLGAEKLYSTVRDFAGSTKNKVIFDLYCGTGTIAQIMAPIAKKVIGIEIVDEAVESAKKNASLNGLTNCHFIAGDVMEKIKELNEKPDLIILDPPRAGIHPKAIHKIIDFGPQKFIYVSCKPTSLAIDLPIFIEKGYKITKIQCIDMFPHTPHVETVVELESSSQK
ncbi:23S rRNA (uracil(1939)-C(5))-methyltransferase RlmD [Garciella nitratireducens]|uniref:23S rRNA (Uracil-5-)-methyltransferase RumA n=1 Tax=Garciella nitratireducens DSM 15102 TaxID=1121911 RepID=A0A1T4NVW1_9FIRM|nr:23S rRNA (uracil(1939)-C(5))-methyltransferase RlmD [Garciella nitratireducens]SJZ83361.1 23S rRNA (uracil-5-)-methyltransferase RumA [Garciella nitratireducens DSM 15102]